MLGQFDFLEDCPYLNQRKSLLRSRSTFLQIHNRAKPLVTQLQLKSKKDEELFSCDIKTPVTLP